MNLAPTDDQRAIKEMFAELLARESTPERVRAAQDEGFDRRLWELLAELGAVAIAVPEDAGGAGAGLLELELIAEELGRRVACTPLVEAALAATLLAQAGDGRLPAAMAGETIAVLAPRPAAGGVAVLVPAGAVAGLVVALDGDELVTVEGAPGALASNLGFEALSDRSLNGEGVRRDVLATGEAARLQFARASSAWRACTAGALAGLAAEAIDIAVRYANERRQFGVPIGSFQAVQHPLAEHVTAADGAQLLAREAAWAADRELPGWQRLAAMAFAHAADTAERASAAALHVHGGYGYTLEYDIQLYVRRAKGLALALGDLEREWEAIGAMTVARR